MRRKPSLERGSARRSRERAKAKCLFASAFTELVSALLRLGKRNTPLWAQCPMAPAVCRGFPPQISPRLSPRDSDLAAWETKARGEKPSLYMLRCRS